MRFKIAGALAALLLLGFASLATAADLKAGDQITLSHKTTMMASLRSHESAGNGDRDQELKPGTVVKVLRSDYGLGKPWYEVETEHGRGWLGAVVLERQAPPREWLEMVGKPVVLKKGQRLSYTVDAPDNYIYTAAQDVKTTVLGVSNLVLSAYKKVTRAQVDVPLANSANRLKGWVNAEDLGR